MSTTVYHTNTLAIKTPAQTREARALALVRSGAVHPVRNRYVVFSAWVQSQSDPQRRYLVTLGPESCSCADYKARRNAGLCKHIIACRYVHGWQVEAAQ